MCLVLVLTCIAVFDSGSTTLSTTHRSSVEEGKAGCASVIACEPLLKRTFVPRVGVIPLLVPLANFQGGKGAVYYYLYPTIVIFPLLLLDTGGPHATPGDFLVHACIFIGQP